MHNTNDNVNLDEFPCELLSVIVVESRREQNVERRSGQTACPGSQQPSYYALSFTAVMLASTVAVQCRCRPGADRFVECRPLGSVYAVDETAWHVDQRLDDLQVAAARGVRQGTAWHGVRQSGVDDVVVDVDVGQQSAQRQNVAVAHS